MNNEKLFVMVSTILLDIIDLIAREMSLEDKFRRSILTCEELLHQIKKNIGE